MPHHVHRNFSGIAGKCCDDVRQAIARYTILSLKLDSIVIDALIMACLRANFTPEMLSFKVFIIKADSSIGANFYSL